MLWVALAFARGTDLERHLAERGPLSVEGALRTGIQIGEALAALHDAGVIHRDLAPAKLAASDRRGASSSSTSAFFRASSRRRIRPKATASPALRRTTRPSKSSMAWPTSGATFGRSAAWSTRWSWAVPPPSVEGGRRRRAPLSTTSRYFRRTCRRRSSTSSMRACARIPSRGSRPRASCSCSPVTRSARSRGGCRRASAPYEPALGAARLAVLVRHDSAAAARPVDAVRDERFPLLARAHRSAAVERDPGLTPLRGRVKGAAQCGPGSPGSASTYG